MESENNIKSDVPSHLSVDSDSSGCNSPVVLRSKSRLSNLWRSRSLSSRNSQKNSISILESIPSVENLDTKSNATAGTVSSYEVEKQRKKDLKDTIVTIVLVEAKGLPNPPDDGSSHSLFCKMRLGSRTFKSKMAANNRQPEWREKFELRLSKDYLLRVSVWDKGKQKSFMGSCVIDMSGLAKDRTHEIWQQLDDGYGSVHLSVTMCNIRNNVTDYSVVEENEMAKEKYSLRNLGTDWNIIGQLHVKVMHAKGLSGKPSAYCTLEVDNQRVQTHSARASSEPTWEKSYVFNIYDISSTLDLKVYDSSLNQIRNESLGRVYIPLLRISSRTVRWYALKDRTKRHSAKGNCPRVLLDMSIFWNPVKAAVRLFQPKEVKYLKKPPRFDLRLVHSNLEFMRDTFQVLYETNESFKSLFEWENRELSFVALLGWLFFWYNITLWGMPLLCILPFLYFWAYQRNQNEKFFRHVYNTVDEKTDVSDVEKDDNKAITLGKIQGLPELTLKITSAVEYMVSLAERMYNLVTFKVPFLSYLAMLFLLISSVALYCIPFNYMMMAFGIYKFSRKYLDPGRQLNNDLLDFISRIPDNDILRDWKELSVPEPIQRNHSKTKLPAYRSLSVL
ncbi:multiple C2 and transmembrane domain-containing protein-like [Plodia interpunctella]|uniref:multiple C2 and transmembrane domain-containing protein-like n=1 Tax=Plodia interpunctella TaxID=58824 RepID=UPI00236836D1|nr:multiple C2 and transmembrane domain-containing protein-like [Plodia interpunctella]